MLKKKALAVNRLIKLLKKKKKNQKKTNVKNKRE